MLFYREVVAVSYTHLDVYKRQVLILASSVLSQCRNNGLFLNMLLQEKHHDY